VTHLRQLVLEELRCRNYAESTNACKGTSRDLPNLPPGTARLKTASVKGDADSE
jgi:hypothetical protein